MSSDYLNLPHEAGCLASKHKIIAWWYKRGTAQAIKADRTPDAGLYVKGWLRQKHVYESRGVE